ncbi:hypothetical protein [Nocardioides sp. B-3]|uniref:hypothetical protein n=1 Tax=Nocardioides sp. B-3 TaxID=2895565 RepID=UPI0021521DAB|nr:hypothetical protein [Nocardioides sp. B-3]UUZ59217.1 hypothetical protein LP418_25475 [Nocardioides sp. B-3]
MTVLGSTLVVLAAGLGIGLSFGLTSGDWGTARGLVVASVPYIVPVLCPAGFTRLLHGLSPRVASLALLGLLFAVTVLMFGEPLSGAGQLVFRNRDIR